MNRMRYAVVHGGTMQQITAYMPGNYRVVGTDDDGGVIISGYDNAGWTMEDYIVPRLQSGLYIARELVVKENA